MNVSKLGHVYSGLGRVGKRKTRFLMRDVKGKVSGPYLGCVIILIKIKNISFCCITTLNTPRGTFGP